MVPSGAPQIGGRLAARAGTAEQGSHQCPRDAASPVARRDSGESHASPGNPSAGDRQLKWEGGYAANSATALRRGARSNVNVHMVLGAHGLMQTSAAS
jgi:hypothetical protein